MMAKEKGVALSGGNGCSKNGKKLLDRAWDAMLAEGFAEAVARRYVSWMREYILFHDKRHPQEMKMPRIDRRGSRVLCI
jgi:hypothetical protein